MVVGFRQLQVNLFSRSASNIHSIQLEIFLSIVLCPFKGLLRHNIAVDIHRQRATDHRAQCGVAKLPIAILILVSREELPIRWKQWLCVRRKHCHWDIRCLVRVEAIQLKEAQVVYRCVLERLLRVVCVSVQWRLVLKQVQRNIANLATCSTFAYHELCGQRRQWVLWFCEAMRNQRRQIRASFVHVVKLDNGVVYVY